MPNNIFDWKRLKRLKVIIRLAVDKSDDVSVIKCLYEIQTFYNNLVSYINDITELGKRQNEHMDKAILVRNHVLDCIIADETLSAIAVANIKNLPYTFAVDTPWSNNITFNEDQLNAYKAFVYTALDKSRKQYMKSKMGINPVYEVISTTISDKSSLRSVLDNQFVS